MLQLISPPRKNLCSPVVRFSGCLGSLCEKVLYSFTQCACVVLVCPPLHAPRGPWGSWCHCSPHKPHPHAIAPALLLIPPSLGRWLQQCLPRAQPQACSSPILPPLTPEGASCVLGLKTYAPSTQVNDNVVSTASRSLWRPVSPSLDLAPGLGPTQIAQSHSHSLGKLWPPSCLSLPLLV